ncbi:MAG: hypothetical protein HQ463_05680 [Bacteroidetes bacterium]|nr:hypothetical protein [Bacteroidota bacterium]
MENNDLNNEFKNNGFRLPENYFEQLNTKVIKNLYSENTHSKLSFWKKNTKWLVAASIALIAGLGILINSNTTGNSEVSFASLSVEECNEYVNNEELTEEEFSEIISNEAVDSIYQMEIVAGSLKTDTETIEDIDNEDVLFEDEIEL